MLVAITCCGLATAQPFHTADRDQDSKLSLSELLRIVQLYNLLSYHCETGTEDGYAPGQGAQDCDQHQADYIDTPWKISLSELLREIQIFNSAGYFACADGEDDYCLRMNDTRPNVVLLILDTLRADRIQATRNGTPIMPFLSSFAAGGTNFTRAYSPSSRTLPAMVSVFAGRYAEHYGELNQTSGAVEFFLPENETALAEFFAKYGYDIWGVQTNSLGLDGYGISQGFPDGRLNFLNVAPAHLVSDAGLADMEQFREPFFFLAQYFDPHGPYQPPVEYEAFFGPQPVLTGTDNVYLSSNFFNTWAADDIKAYYLKQPRETGPLTADGIEAMRYRYDADTRYMDDEIKRMIEAMLDRYPNTIVVVMADHGESLMERDIHGHGHAVFEELTHVPFFFRGPGIPAEQTDRRVNTLDLQPTLARLIGASPLPQWEGHDILKTKPIEPVFSYSWNASNGVDILARCVADDNLKYIVDSHTDNVPQMYDLAADPLELNNLATSQPEDAARLKALLDTHIAAMQP